MAISEKLIKNICRDYITIDYNGILDFKLTLKDNIRNNSISEEDALFILLELLYRVNQGLKYKLASKNLFDLIKKVKKYNKENKDHVKEKFIFNKPYYLEVKQIIDYIIFLAQDKNIKSKNITIKKPKENIKLRKKLIKIKLKDFKHDDLCHILDLEPALNFEREKVLKNRIIDKLLEISFEEDKLNNCSAEDIKEIINSSNKSPGITNGEIIKIQNVRLYRLLDEFEEAYNIQLKKENELKQQKKEKERLKKEKEEKLKKEIEERKRQEQERLRKEAEIEKERLQKERQEKQRQIDSLISEVNSFNNKSLSEMLSLEEEYSRTYDQILRNCSVLSQYPEIALFNDYYSHLNNIKEIIVLEKEIKNNISLLNRFNEDLNNNGFLNYFKREKIINKYESLYKLTSKVDKFPIFLKSRVYQEFVNLDGFMKYYEDLMNYKNLSDEKPNKIKIINEKILDDEIKDNPEFFKNITDPNKKRAIVIDEKNVKVNAGAGTGKTFTIQNKVNYLIEKKGVSPKKILCLCYTGEGANDLNKKVNKNRDENNQVEACTFHEFCRRVAKKCGISKGKTNRKLLKDTITKYWMELADDENLTKLIDYFSYYINSPADKDDINTYDELLSYENERDLKTLRKKFYESGTNYTMKGETVDSIGELIIANYLFRHDIDYVYGMEYKSKLVEIIQRFLYSGNSFSLISPEMQKEWFENFSSDLWDSYVPDFYLPEKDIYLEHFGIGHGDNEKWLGKDYEPQIERKIRYHELHQTKLIKTYYCYLEDGILEEKLEEILKDNGITIGQKDTRELLDVLMKTKKVEDFDNFNKLLESFINIFEAQNKEKNQFDLFIKLNESESDGYKRNRQKLFLDIVRDVYDVYYESNEGERIDSNREVSLALELIQTNRYSASYEYIFIDEYQDINPIRSLLLQSLQKITNAKLFVVGDDWQSIYKFNGSDLNLFIDFDKYFPNSEFINLQENRRNYDKLNRISSRFIMRNEKQEKKKLISKKRNNPNPINIVYYSIYPERNKVLKLYSIIHRIAKRNPKSRILLLGRNNKDINEFTEKNAIFESLNSGKIKMIKCLQNPELNITFMTTHSSKGLEYDDVIILNFKNKLNGFPNKIEDDSVLRFLKEKEVYPYAEERRLLYVALTRTLNNVYLLAPNYNPSVFIEELINKHKVNKLNLPVDKTLEKNFYKPPKSNKPFDYRETDIKCPLCKDGKITVVRNNTKKSPTMYIRCSKHRDNSCNYNGGPYWGDLEDYIFIEKCPNPNCDGVLIKGYNENKLICSLNDNHKGCKETKEIN